MIPIVSSADSATVDRLLRPKRSSDADLERKVARIVEDVRIGGDAALRTYAEQLDGLSGPFEVSRGEIARASGRRPRGFERPSGMRHVISRASRAPRFHAGSECVWPPA